MRHVPRVGLRVGTAVSAVLLAAACGGTPSNPPSAPPGGPPGGPFPVTITHEFGSTTIEAPPQRIVALGVTDADPLLALGITPVAVTGYTFYESGLGPWAEERITGEAPLRLDSDSTPDLEQIAALAPDLIVGVSAGFDQAVYDRLRLIAPTVARPAGTDSYTVARADATAQIATAVGRGPDGEALNRRADEAFAAAVAAHPEFGGLTGSVVLPYEGRYGAYTPGDSRGRFLAALGFVPAPGIASLGPSDGYFVEIAPEQAGLLDGDVLVMLADQPAQRQAVAQDPVLQQVPVVVDGRMVLTDLDTRGAMTYNTVLSVPYALDRLVPQLAAALR